MGVVLPGWADELLDLIGVSWPNVDEDDYREMANAMREFADDIDEGAGEAHTAIEGLIGSSGGSLAAEALNAHWGKVNGQHLKGLADCGRMAATAMDGVAVLIEGAKIGALVQLGILAAEVIAAQAAAPFTFGLSELGALGATQATRMILKRLFKEVCQQVAEQVISIALTPVEEALGAMVGDLVVQLGANALGAQKGVDLGRTAQAGKEGFGQGVQDAKDSVKAAAGGQMELLSAGSLRGGGGGLGTSGRGGSSSGGSGGFSFDKDEHHRAVTSLQSAGKTFRNKAGGKIGRARSHHGRTRGKDAIADAANVMLDKVIEGIEDGVKKTAKHLDDNMTRGIKQMAKNHHENDKGLADHFKGLGKGGKGDPKGPNRGGSDTGVSGGGTPPNSKDPQSKGPAKSKAAEQADADHPHDKTRKDEGKCRDGTDPVDLASGKVFLSQTDIVLPGMLPLAFSRRFESSTRIGRHIGPSWSSTIDQRLEIDDEEVVFVTESGMLLRYAHPQAGEQVLPKHGPRWPLLRTDQGDWAVHDPQTGQTRYFSDALHTPGLALPDEITDRNGHWIAFDYADETGIPYALRHSAGYELKLTCDEHGRLITLHLADAADDGSDQLIRSYGHDDDGNLTTVTNATGAITRFEYDSEHRMTAWVDSNGSRYEYTYDHRHRCLTQSGAEGHLANRFTYGEADPETGHRTTTHTNGEGSSTRYLVNERLQVIAVTDPLGNTTRTTYDAHDRPLQITNPLGHTTHLAYDENGHLVSLVHPDGSTSTATYTGLGLPAEVTGPDGQSFRQEYDAKGNRIAVTDPAGRTTRFTHDERGHLTSVTDPLGSTSHVECDRAGLPLTVTDPLGAVTVFCRDTFGRTTSTTDPLGNITHYQWNPDGLLTSRSNPDATQESWTYDGEGNCTSHTDPMGQVTTFEYGHFDQLKARTGPDGARHEFVHDTELKLMKVINPQGLTWRYEYDAAGRLISETDFDARTQSYTHDAAGRLTSRTTPLGHTIRFTHDALGRTVTKDVDGEITTYTYDAATRLAQITAPHSTLTYTRDTSGQIVAETVNGRTTTYSYDALGRRISRTTPTGATSRWTYDAAGRRTGLDAAGRTLAFTHDALGQELSRALGDITFTQQFDTLGRLTDQHVTSATETIQHRAYSYRADGYLTGVDDHLNGARRFTLDPAGRVTTVSAHNWSETYAYDAAGNQTHATWPDRHPLPEARGERAYTGTRIHRAGAIRYEYDAAGRTTLRQKTRLSRKPDTWHYTWDAEDRLIACTTADGTAWRYTYDPLGRRTAKLRLTEDGRHIAEQVDFTWDGTTLCEQTTLVHGTSTQTTLTWDHQGHTPLTQHERLTAAHAPQHVVDERFFAIITDLAGAPTELLDEAGSIAARTRTTLWGTTTWNTQATAHTPLRFPGQYFDPETELHYNYFRTYAPETARYTTPDPLGLSPAPNPTTYVHNPHTWSDPLGLAPCHDGTQPAGVSGQATVRWDVDQEHATIRVEGNDRYMETEQVINGWDGTGSPNGFPTTGAGAQRLGPNVIERTFQVPDVNAAIDAQLRSINADLGAYDGIHNSCVTYCVEILRAGGVDIPAGARGMIALKRTLG
ncbi:RHS repeat-associated core domain-containing protein [Streptomyces rimosus]|uniref:RHS repeat-associated core domain-containing protein n=1 Tax=Streptomyces rimosus TaxID=1927 RepID=UPI001F29B420|nr:RHS repeat-associated core domain-containing protein [Streptomyces rimosus]